MPTPSSSTALPRGNTVDHLFHQLKNAIQNGQLAPGQRLIEADLTKDYGVSRGPLREALRRLSAEGIIDFVPNKGAIVKRFSPKEIVDIFRIRQALEGLATRLATENLDADKHRKHWKMLEQFVKALAEEDFEFSEENRTFHNIILELCDNTQLQTLILQMQLPFLRYQIRGSLDRAYVHSSRKEHADIARAMLGHDAKLAEKRMQQHLGKALDRLMSLRPDLFR